MPKQNLKNILLPMLLASSIFIVSGCQNGKSPVSEISDAPPGAESTVDNRLLASMGSVNLGNKQVLDYFRSLDPSIINSALSKDNGLEDLVKGVALRFNVLTRAAGQKWQERPEVKAAVEDAQRTLLYSLYVNEKNAPPAGFPDDATVAKVYENTQQKQAAAGEPALKPLKDIAPVIKKQLRDAQRQENEQKYLNGLVTSNPISVDMQKLIAYINLTQEQKNLQGPALLKESVASMGDLGVTLGLTVNSLVVMEPSRQRALLANTPQLQQFVTRLTLQYFVINQAIAEKFNARPAVNNLLEQQRMQVLYSTYMKAWAAPESDFPSAALVEENYRKNLGKLVVPERFNLAKIVLANSGDAAADQAKAQQITAAARSGGNDFATLAQQFSQDPQSAKNGGDVGWLNGNALQPQLGKMVRENGAGAVIGPIKYDWGWQIVKVLGHQSARQQTLDEARPALVDALRKKRMAEKEKEVLELLLASEPVTIDQAALKQLRKQVRG